MKFGEGFEGVYGVRISGLVSLNRVDVCGVANPYGDGFRGV